MTYRRGNALWYAATYFNRVCDDGCVATNDHQKSSLVRLAPSSQLPKEINHEDDCAHFVSCCIGRLGGGLLLGQWELPPAYGVLSPDSLLERLTRKGLASVAGRDLMAADAATAVPAMDPGDVILYGSFDGLFHSAQHLGGGAIACHTSSRWALPFTSVTFITVTLLHIL
jgi:hypothetical protein